MSTRNRRNTRTRNELNSTTSHWLRGLTDDEIRERCVEVADKFIAKNFPGSPVTGLPLAEALTKTNCDFEVALRPIFAVHSDQGLADEDAPISEIPGSIGVASCRTDTNTPLGIVGENYGIVQTTNALQALDILADRGDLSIRNVEPVGNGARIRVTALLGVSTFPSADGAPNTLCHFAIFEATHDGSKHTSATVFTLRLECFNGLTSRSLVTSLKLRHTSRVSDRVEAYTQNILSSLIGDAEAEVAWYQHLAAQKCSVETFVDIATELLGGEPERDAEVDGYSQSKVTRFDNQIEELLGYFNGGNQGAGETAWGAYNSITRWLEAKREKLSDSAKVAKKFSSNLEGDGQKKIQKAAKLLRARF